MGISGAAIVGAGGFLGAHLVRGFEARGADVLPIVRALDERSPAGARVLDEALDDPASLQGLDAVVHVAAAQSHPGTDPSALRTANLELLERSMRMTAGARVPRFVFVSTVGVYGFPARLPVTEEHPYGPRTAHAATRVEAEMRARRVARDLGLQLVIVRPARVYGPGAQTGSSSGSPP